MGENCKECNVKNVSECYECDQGYRTSGYERTGPAIGTSCEVVPPKASERECPCENGTPIVPGCDYRNQAKCSACNKGYTVSERGYCEKCPHGCAECSGGPGRLARLERFRVNFRGIDGPRLAAQSNEGRPYICKACDEGYRRVD